MILSIALCIFKPQSMILSITLCIFKPQSINFKQNSTLHFIFFFKHSFILQLLLGKKKRSTYPLAKFLSPKGRQTNIIFLALVVNLNDLQMNTVFTKDIL